MLGLHLNEIDGREKELLCKIHRGKSHLRLSSTTYKPRTVNNIAEYMNSCKMLSFIGYLLRILALSRCCYAVSNLLWRWEIWKLSYKN